MKADLKKAVDLLSKSEYTCVLFKESKVFTSRERGVKPLVEWLNSKTDFRGFCAADKVVGKAAAFLYVLLGVNAVYAPVMSKSAYEILSEHGIEPLCDLSVEVIRNRSNTGLCPMEKTVMDIDDPETAFLMIKNKIESMAVLSGNNK